MALESIFTRDEKFPELLEIYRRRVDIAPDNDQRLEFLFRIAQIHEQMLNAPDDAIETYIEILGQAPDDLKALRALDRLYVGRAAWRDLGDNITRQLALVDQPAEQVGLLVRLAQLRETHLGEVAAAVETYRQVLDHEAANPDAIMALERLITQPEHELTIAAILEPIYKSRGDWAKQIGVYEIMAKHAFDPVRKIELLHQIAELHEIGGDDAGNSFATFARALREDPRNEVTHQQLDRLARQLDKWQDAAELYDSVSGEAQEDDLKVALLFRRAQIQEHELRDDKAAVATYERILAQAPQTVEAATAIQTIHERTGDWPKLVDILKRKSEILTNVDERKQLLYRAAQIEEEVLGNADAAIATFRQVLSIDDIDMVAMDALERLYVRLARWEPLKDVYAKKADLAEDPADKKRMLYVLAQVYDRELGDVAKAIETYQGILDLDADELPAIQSLDRLYGQAERWYDLLGNLERQVELSETTGETVALKYRIGHLWQIRLGDVARAIESYREALDMDPSHAETLHALDGLVHGKTEPVMAARVLEPIYDASAEWAKLVDVLEVMVAHNEDPLARVDLLHRIAALHEQRIGNANAAFDAYARALRDDSGNPATLGHIERLAEITGTWTPLAALYQAEADKSLDVPRQVDLLSRLARVHEQELHDVPKAIATLRKLLDVEFDNKPAVLALDRLYTQTNAWAELTEILRREIQLVDGANAASEIAGLQFRLGQVLQTQLTDRKGAIEVYREILADQPTHAPTIGALEAMFHAGYLQAEIGNVLEPLYEAANEYGKLHAIYEVQLGKLSGPDRQAMYQRLAELAEGRLYDQGRAFHWWSEALVEDPRWDHAIEESERLAGETGSWDDMVAAYTRALETTKDKDVQRQTLLRLARVHEYQLQDAARAVETHLRVLELEAKDPEALASLDRLYLGAGMYEDLAEILRRRIEVTQDTDEQLELYFRRGAIFADALGDLDLALGCYTAVLEQESRNRRALEAIESIHFRRQDWPKLFETYEKLIDVADGDNEMADIYAHMARIASEALDAEEKSIELWGNVLDIRGEEPQALQALGELCTRRERWEELVEIIERQIAATVGDHEQIILYKQLGHIWADKLSRERNALDAWLAADRIDGNDLETLRALAHLYRSTQAWDELTQTLRRIIEVGQLISPADGGLSETETIELYAQLGQLEGDVLGRVDAAVDAWRQVIAIDPSDFRALAALEGLFTREGRWEESIDVLEKRALVLDDETQRRETLLQAASTWEEKVEDLTKAAQVYERVRASDPANITASDRLEAIYRQQYKWTELVEVLLQQSELRPKVTEQISILNQVGKIYESEIGDQESAFYVLQAAFKRDYAHEETGRELERLATATNRWQELLDEYTNRVNELERENRSAASDLWVKIGRWYGEHLSHLEYAIHSVQQALRIDPSHTGALSAIADLQRKRGSWSELIETLQRHAGVENDQAKKTELYIQLAELLERRMQDIGGAIHAYQQALVCDHASKGALTALDRLYRRTEQWEPLIDVLSRRAELETEEQAIVRFRLEIGQIWDLRLYDAGQSITAYQQVLDTDPQNLTALRALEALYEKTNQSEKYLEVLEAQLDASEADAERVALYERMAAAWEERFGKLDRAAEALEKIVAIDSRNYSAYRELARLYQQAAKWEALVETYRNHIMATSDVQQRVDLYVAMGVTYDQSLGDVDRAVESYNDVLGLDADEPRALDALGRLYEKINEWDRAVDMMAHLVRTVGGSADDARKQVELYTRMGRIQYSQLGNAEDAEANLLRGLAIDQSHVPAMEALTKQYSDRGDWLKAAQMMVRAESYTQVVIEKVRLLHEAAKIYQEKLRQNDAAKQLYAAVISLDPEHVDAGRPLAELYFESQEWQQLSSVIEMLVRKVAQLHADPRELNELYYRAARTADELGDFQKALRLLQERLRHRFDVPADPGRPGRPAVQDAGLGQRREDLPDHPGPAPRRPGRGRRRQDLQPAGHGPAGVGRAQEGAQHVREGAGDRPQPPRHAAGGHRPAAAAGRLGGGRPRQARPDGHRAAEGEGVAARRDRRHLPRQARQLAEGHRGLPRGARVGARRPPAAAEGARPLHRDQAVEEGGRDHRAVHRARSRRRPPRRVLPRRRDRVPRRAEVARRGGRVLQQGARQLLRQPGAAARVDDPARAQGVRGDRQGADDQARLEGAGARLPRHGQAATQARLADVPQAARRSVRRPRRDLPVAAQALPVGDAGVRDQPAARSQERAAPGRYRPRRNPGRALPRCGPRLHRQGSPAAHADAPQRAVQVRLVQGAAPHLHGRAPVRQDLVRVQHARVPQEGRPRRAAVLRAVQAARAGQGEERDERRHLGQARSPRREPLHLGDLRRQLAGRRRDEGVPAQGLRHQAEGQAAARRQPADVQQAVLLRRAGAQRAAPRGLPRRGRQAGRHPARELHREGGAVPVVRGEAAPAAGQERARDRVPVGAPAHVHAPRVLPEDAAADEHRAQGRRAVGDRDAAAAVPGAAGLGGAGAAVRARDAEADPAAVPGAARHGGEPLHPGRAGDQPRQVGARGRRGVAPRGLRRVRRS